MVVHDIAVERSPRWLTENPSLMENTKSISRNWFNSQKSFIAR